MSQPFSQPPVPVSEDDLRRGIHIRIPDRKNDQRTRIKPGERVRGEVLLPSGQASRPAELQIEAGAEFYFE
jgi:hypothetical protein